MFHYLKYYYLINTNVMENSLKDRYSRFNLLFYYANINFIKIDIKCLYLLQSDICIFKIDKNKNKFDTYIFVITFQFLASQNCP